MGDYRVILLYKAATDKAAIEMAAKAAKGIEGKVDRVTTRRETWGSVAEEE